MRKKADCLKGTFLDLLKSSLVMFCFYRISWKIYWYKCIYYCESQPWQGARGLSTFRFTSNKSKRCWWTAIFLWG